MKKYPYTAEYEDEITVRAGALEKKIPVKLKFKLVDKTWSGSSGGRSSGGGRTGSVLKKDQNTGNSQRAVSPVSGESRRMEAGNLFPAEERMPMSGPGSTTHMRKKDRKRLPGSILRLTAGCRQGGFSMKRWKLVLSPEDK